MAFYSLFSDIFDIDKDQGTIDMTSLYELEPYINGITRLYTLSDPYSLLLSVVDHSYSEYSFRFTLFTPDYVLYIAFTEEEFQNIAFDDSVKPNTFRLTYVLDGTLYQEIEGEKQCYGKNDTCFLSPQILQSIEYKTDFTAVTVFYSRKYFQNTVSADPSKFLNVLLYRDYYFRFRPTLQSSVCICIGRLLLLKIFLNILSCRCASRKEQTRFSLSASRN